LRIDGNFHGSISTGDILIIGEHALVHADIKAGEIEIAGQVNGRIEAKRRVDIRANGRIRGDVHAPVLSVSPGGVVDGRIQMSGDYPEETTVVAGTLNQQSRVRQETD